MYPVSQDFLDKMKADRRRVLARVEIDYTDPFMDQSIDIEASENANISYPQQTADSVQETTLKWASLDGSWALNGTYHLAPPPEKLAQYQFGWWGLQLAGAGGVFLSPYPSLTVTHLPRPIHTLRVVGDTARGEYPVDFTVKLYAQNEAILYTETVTGNTQVNWSKTLAVPVLDVAKQVLEITRWSHEGRQAKIIEFFTSIREIYEIGDLMSLHLLEEREASQGSLPVGNISSNEITLVLNNEDKKFDVDNEQSPLFRLLKPNRRIRAWLGIPADLQPALFFNGTSNHVAIPNTNGLLAPTQQTTWELWFRVGPTPDAYDTLMGFGTNNWDMRMDSMTLITCHTYDTGGNWVPIMLTSPTPLNDGQWHHLAIVWDGVNGVRRGYIDGVQRYAGTMPPDTMPRDMTGVPTFSIGAVGGIRHFNGHICEVRIWTTARTQQEIIDNMHRRLDGSEPGLRAYYRFDDEEGSTLRDSGPNGLHGTIVGAQWVVPKDNPLGRSEEWVPLGTFWSLDWDSPDDALEAIVTARDRMELLRKGTYQTSQVLQNKSLYELAEIVLQDAGLTSDEYIIDTDLQNIIIPYAWFNPMSHREALRLIAEAGLAAAFQNRDGKIQIESFLIEDDEPVLEITEDDYFPPLRAPSRQDQVANEIIVDTQPLRPATTSEEVYRSNEPITIPGSSTKTVTAFYNQPPVIEAAASLDSPAAGVSIVDVTYYGWGASVKIQNTNATDKQVIPYIEGKPLTVRNKERAIARDETSITENGALRFEFPANPLVQTLDQAQAIANALLASVKDPRRDVEVEWRGNPALLLGDRVTVKGKDYHVIRQEISWAGYMQAKLTGRKAE